MYYEDLVSNYVFSQRPEAIAQDYDVKVKTCEDGSDEITLTGVLEVDADIHKLDRMPDGWADFLEFRGSRHEVTRKAEELQEEFIEACEDQYLWTTVADIEKEIRNDFLKFAENTDCEDPVDDIFVRVQLSVSRDLFNADYLVEEREAALLVSA